MTRQPDTSNVPVRPTVLFLVALAIGLVADRLIVPLDILSGLRWSWRQFIGGVMIVAGMAGVVDCTRRFREAGTSVHSRQASRAIVDSGLYRYSRNPIYLALSTIHLGVAVADNNAWLPLLLVPLLIVVRYTVIAREELYLERRFGVQYAAYKARVRRWL